MGVAENEEGCNGSARDGWGTSGVSPGTSITTLFVCRETSRTGPSGRRFRHLARRLPGCPDLAVFP
jgi:hypothetical protein